MIILLNIILSVLLTSEEIERRLALDFNKDLKDIMPYIQKYYPEADSLQISEWEKSKALEFQIIGGNKKYFKNADKNLFRIDSKSKDLKTSIEGKEKAGRDEIKKNHIKEILSAVKEKDGRNNLYLKHDWNFFFRMYIPDTCNIDGGETISAWLPAPNSTIRRQRNCELVYADGDVELYNKDGHASAFMQKEIRCGRQLNFSVSYRFTTFAEYHKPPKHFKHAAADTEDSELKPFLSERIPHCIFSNRIKHLADSIVGDETRPYFQARKLFTAIRELYPWTSAREYSTIENIPEYVIENKHGDCGQVVLLYIAMCRYKGIPAKWQSGFMLHPGYENLHDWCEIYIEGMGWIPVDPSFGVQEWGNSEEERFFYFGGIDAYRMIVNTDWSAILNPAKEFERSETVDFQRGECESEKGNLYFDKWKYEFNVNIIK